MKVKHLVIAMALLLCVAFTISAQQKSETAKAAIPDSKSESPKTDAGRDARAPAAPEFKAEDLLKIRDIQYRNAQRAAQMKTLEQQYDQLQKLQDADIQKIDRVVNDAAKAAGVDLAKWIIDLEALKLVPREKPAPATEPGPKSKVQSPD